MESQVIKKLLEKGKITLEDINEAMEEIPSKDELEIIDRLMFMYGVPEKRVIEVWVSHFLPILRGVSQKINELSNPEP